MKFIKISSFLLCLAILYSFVELPTNNENKRDRSIRVTKITLILQNDTIKDFSATLINDNIFNQEFYKELTLLNASIVLSVNSMLYIKYNSNSFIISDFNNYVDKLSNNIEITYIIKDINFTCTNVEFAKKGVIYITESASQYQQSKINCNYAIVKTRR